ncbi:hypothetical protein HK101_008247 [Irineochytrium annulatum]|nr:hypothetical protein HK101_008247 [Irineochytrium annulatum]
MSKRKLGDGDGEGFDVDTYLRVEATTFNQDLEVDRILALGTKGANPIEILDLPGSTWTECKLDPKDVKMSYRKKSLLLHPDKCKHVKAPEAFELLKKAEQELMDEGKKAWFMALINESRQIVFRKRGLISKPGLPAPVVPTFERDPAAAAELAAAIKIQTRQLLSDQSGRESLRIKNEVERKAQEVTQAAEERRRMQEYNKAWEETRDGRVGSWRNFVKKDEKKKKRKKDSEKNGVLG